MNPKKEATFDKAGPALQWGILVLLILVFTYVVTDQTIDPKILRFANLANSPHPDPAAFNRWFSIYLLMPFVFLSGSVTQGMFILNAIILTGSVLLVFLIGRMLDHEKASSKGLISVLLYAYTGVLFFGNTDFSDLSVLGLALIGIWSLVKANQAAGRTKNILLLIVGASLFFAVKSKETGIVLPVILFGLESAFTWDRKSLAKFLSQMGWVLLGGFIALVVLFFADAIFLKDPFFSVRSTSISAYSLEVFGTPDLMAGIKSTIFSWYALFDTIILRNLKRLGNFVLGQYTLLIVLYFVSLVRQFAHPPVRKFHKGIGFLPLAWFAFLVLMDSETSPSSFLVALPLLAVFSAQNFSLKIGQAVSWPEHTRNTRHIDLAVVSLCILIFAIARYGVSISEIYKGLLYYPSATLILITAISPQAEKRIHPVFFTAAIIAVSIFGFFQS